MGRICAVLGEASRRYPTDVCAGYASAGRGRQIGTGHVVLDIATGPGEPALSVAGLVGPTGKVFGIDPIPGMVAASRRAASRLGLRNVQFDVAFADKMPFPADRFDAVLRPVRGDVLSRTGARHTRDVASP